MQLLTQEQSRYVAGGNAICQCLQQHAQGMGLPLPSFMGEPRASTCLMSDTIEINRAWSA